MGEHRHKKIPWTRPLADFVQTVIDPALARRGFGKSSLVLFWNDIVGDRLASMSRPVKVQWPASQYHRHPAKESECAAATLVVRVESGFALELQHLAPLVIERVNAHLGWRCVSRLKLEQGPVAGCLGIKRVPQPIDKDAEETAQKLIGHSMSEPLRQALVRLGARIFGGS
jgi:hypothetical protein